MMMWKLACIFGASFVAIFAYLVHTQNEIDSCDVNLNESEIKALFVDAMKERGVYFRLSKDNVHFESTKALWRITTLAPKSRQDAESEFDMTKYDIIAEQSGMRIHAEIGACKNVINMSSRAIQ